MSRYPASEDPANKPSDVVEEAAALVLAAHAEAVGMLARAGLPNRRFVRGHCRVMVDGRPCGCSHYTGDHGGTCLTRVTQDPGASEPLRSCGHLPSQHLILEDDEDSSDHPI